MLVFCGGIFVWLKRKQKSPFVENVRGLIVPLITPLNEDLSIDFISLKTHISWLLNRGVRNFFLLSNISENDFFSLEEKKQIITYVEREFSNKANFIVGCFGESSEQIIEQVLFAEKHADYCVINVPFSAITNEIFFIDFFEELFNRTKSNIFIYNNPFLFKRNVPIVAFDKIAGWERLVGFIDASRNLEYFKSLSNYSQVVKLYQEPDELFYDSVNLNCSGIVPFLANIYPKFFLDSIKEVNSLNYIEVVKKNASFLSFIREYFPMRSRIQLVKYYLSGIGITQPFFHKELGELSEEQKEKIDSLMKQKALV